MKFVPDVLRVQFQYAAQFQGVERPYETRGHHDVIGVLVAYQYLPVAVQDEPSGRVTGLVKEGVVLRADLEAVVQQLQAEELCGQEQECYCKSGYKVLESVLAVVHVHLPPAVVMVCAYNIEEGHQQRVDGEGNAKFGQAKADGPESRTVQ